MGFVYNMYKCKIKLGTWIVCRESEKQRKQKATHSDRFPIFILSLRHAIFRIAVDLLYAVPRRHSRFNEWTFATWIFGFFDLPGWLFLTWLKTMQD